jgi:hypothetical protein
MTVSISLSVGGEHRLSRWVVEDDPSIVTSLHAVYKLFSVEAVRLGPLTLFLLLVSM